MNWKLLEIEARAGYFLGPTGKRLTTDTPRVLSREDNYRVEMAVPEALSSEALRRCQTCWRTDLVDQVTTDAVVGQSVRFTFDDGDQLISVRRKRRLFVVDISLPSIFSTDVRLAISEEALLPRPENTTLPVGTYTRRKQRTSLHHPDAPCRADITKVSDKSNTSVFEVEVESTATIANFDDLLSAAEVVLLSICKLVAQSDASNAPAALNLTAIGAKDDQATDINKALGKRERSLEASETLDSATRPTSR